MAAGAAAAALGREGGEDAFRRLFRFYRQRDAKDLRGVLDFSAPGGQVTACAGPGSLGGAVGPRRPVPARGRVRTQPLGFASLVVESKGRTGPGVGALLRVAPPDGVQITAQHFFSQ